MSKKKIRFIKRDTDVKECMATLGNTVGMGDVVPPSMTSAGSGDNFGTSFPVVTKPSAYKKKKKKTIKKKKRK